ncbi:MAG: internal scaffolding protein [Arizlama microvirus]|nr:MAG: internal scaffolding protein [Arizlama microvirus]
MKITNHHELRNRVTIDCSSPKLTDQSYKNLCDINNIMAQYAKTGTFGHLATRQPQYIDNTMIPNLEDAFSIARNATDLFNSLPADIRKLMDNNPINLESFVHNPDNADMLLKHGLIVKRETQVIPKKTDTGITGGDSDDKNLSNSVKNS